MVHHSIKYRVFSCLYLLQWYQSIWSKEKFWLPSVQTSTSQQQQWFWLWCIHHSQQSRFQFFFISGYSICWRKGLLWDLEEHIIWYTKETRSEAISGSKHTVGQYSRGGFLSSFFFVDLMWTHQRYLIEMKFGKHGRPVLQGFLVNFPYFFTTQGTDFAPFRFQQYSFIAAVALFTKISNLAIFQLHLSGNYYVILYLQPDYWSDHTVVI